MEKSHVILDLIEVDKRTGSETILRPTVITDGDVFQTLTRDNGIIWEMRMQTIRDGLVRIEMKTFTDLTEGK